MDLNASFEPPDEEKARPQTPFVEVSNLKDMSLETELVLQYNKANRLLWAAEYDQEIPLGQKASALNAIRSVLADIIRMQTELYNAERLKLLEATLLEVLKEYPAVQAEFLSRYKERLGV